MWSGPLGDEQAPGASGDLRDGPDEDEKLAPLDLLFVFECPLIRNIPAGERARQAASLSLYRLLIAWSLTPLLQDLPVRVLSLDVIEGSAAVPASRPFDSRQQATPRLDRRPRRGPVLARTRNPGLQCTRPRREPRRRGPRAPPSRGERSIPPQGRRGAPQSGCPHWAEQPTEQRPGLRARPLTPTRRGCHGRSAPPTLFVYRSSESLGVRVFLLIASARRFWRPRGAPMIAAARRPPGAGARLSPHFGWILGGAVWGPRLHLPRGGGVPFDFFVDFGVGAFPCVVGGCGGRRWGGVVVLPPLRPCFSFGRWRARGAAAPGFLAPRASRAGFGRVGGGGAGCVMGASVVPVGGGRLLGYPESHGVHKNGDDGSPKGQNRPSLELQHLAPSAPGVSTPGYTADQRSRLVRRRADQSTGRSWWSDIAARDAD